MPVCNIALHTARNSHGCPTQSWKPAGWAPDSRRISRRNSIIPTGVEKEEWLDGDMQSWPIGTPRVREISAETLAAGNTPPCPGFAPWLIFSSTILTSSSAAVSPKGSDENVPAGLPGLKHPETLSQQLSPAFSRVEGKSPASPVSLGQ